MVRNVTRFVTGFSLEPWFLRQSPSVPDGFRRIAFLLPAEVNK